MAHWQKNPNKTLCHMWWMMNMNTNTNILFWKSEKVLPQNNNMQKSCVSTPIMVNGDTHTFLLRLLRGEREKASGAKTMPVTSFNWFNVEPKMLMMLIVVYNFGTTDFYEASRQAGLRYYTKNMPKSDVTTNYCLLIISTSRFFLLFNMNDKRHTCTRTLCVTAILSIHQ